MLRIISGISISLLLCGIGIFMLYRSLHLQKVGIMAIGTVIRVKRNRGSYVPTVRFETLKGKSVEVQLAGWGISQLPGYQGISYQVGQALAILYDPDSPKTVVERNFEMMWLLPIALIIVSILAIYVTFFGF